MGHALWSPQKDRGGAKRYEIMKTIEKGDIVFHIDQVNNEFMGISKVKSQGDDNFYCLAGTEWDYNNDGKTKGYSVLLQNFELFKTN